MSVRIILACGATCLDASHTLWNFLCQAEFKSWCRIFLVPLFDYSQNQCPAEYNVRSIRKLSALKPSSTPTCSRTHHHPQQPPSYPRGEGRWSRRVVSRSSPELKSAASRPSLSIRCTGKNGRKTHRLRGRQTARCLTSDDHFSGDVSRVPSHEHRREFAGR